jgi:hypothetical protein
MWSSLRIATLALIPAVALLEPSGDRRENFLFSAIAPVGESCGTGKDLIVQALERLDEKSPPKQLVEANELLKRAADLCSESGDAWYYRSLVEEKLGHGPVAAYALRTAHKFPSEALDESLNPFILATPPPSSAKPLQQLHQKWALVIGIGSFSDSNIEPLRYSTGDAEGFRDVLVKAGGFESDHVRLLTDTGATLRTIKENLNWLARSAAPDDLVVVYIASHGSSRELDTAGANYIITHDTDVGAKLNPDTLYATALPMVELANAIATRLKSRRTAIFIDTCYSGGAAEPGKLIAPGVATASVSRSTLDHISQGSGRVIFAASQTDQESLESDALHHGYFTYFLIQAIHDHPEMPLSKVFASVQKQVSDRVETDYKKYHLHQNPVMSRSSDDADFALGAPATSVASVADLTSTSIASNRQRGASGAR